MRYFRLLIIVFFTWIGVASANEAEPNLLQVADPYIEMHTGPGRGYPVFHVINRDDWVEILLRYTDWFKVKSEGGIIGWVSRAELHQTLNPDGRPVDIKDVTHDDFMVRKWEAGMMSGDFGGGYSITAYMGYHFTENISAEFALSQVLGNISNSFLWSLSLAHEPFPEWTISPYFALGTGIVNTQARSTITQVKDGSDNFSYVGVGARMHLTKRFFVRVDYNDYVTFTSRNSNEDIREWRAGFAFFF